MTDCVICKIMTDKLTREQQNEKLRDYIVDLADIWDGKESIRYGKKLYSILDKLGIGDIPKYYSNEYAYKIVDELVHEMKKENLD